MSRWSGRRVAFTLATLAACAGSADVATLWIFGDSTVKDYANAQDACSAVLKISGWSEYVMGFLRPDSLGRLSTVFAADSLVLQNRANGGRAARSFINGADSAILRKAYAAMKPGDCMMVQFAHNDEASCADYPERCTSIEDYKKYLRMYVDSIRAHKATPILITSMVRNAWPEYNTHDNSDGSNTRQQTGNYPLAMQQVAMEKGVPCVNLAQRSIDFFNKAGDDATKYQYFRKVRSGTTLPSGCTGINDGTHFQQGGAKAMATLIHAGLASLRKVQVDIRDTAKGTVVGTSNGVKNKANTSYIQLVNDFRNGPGWYERDFNATVKIEAKPKAGIKFTGWSGDTVATANPLVLPLSRNYAITASFQSTTSAAPPTAREVGIATRYDASARTLRVDAFQARTLRVRVLALDGRSLGTARFESSDGVGTVSLPMADAPRAPLLVQCVADGRPATEIVLPE